MVQATMFEAKTQLSDLVRRAQRGEKVILTSGRARVPVAEIVAIQPAPQRVFGQFFQPGFRIPSDFDEVPESELAGWLGKGE
ncbi:MAG: type II toxin-antitoxin system Phd/YefM family antitoxin [Acidobacteriaceae bacterium]